MFNLDFSKAEASLLNHDFLSKKIKINITMKKTKKNKLNFTF